MTWPLQPLFTLRGPCARHIIIGTATLPTASQHGTPPPRLQAASTVALIAQTIPPALSTFPVKGHMPLSLLQLLLMRKNQKWKTSRDQLQLNPFQPCPCLTSS